MYHRTRPCETPLTTTSLPMSETDNRSELLAKLQQHAEKVKDVEQSCTDEAKTEIYLVEPFLDILGYNSRDPRDVHKRFVADVADRKGEKVDYALMRDGNPVVLVEAKGKDNRLGRGEIQQLQRYFPHTSAKLAVLTDGIRWHWYKGRSERDESHLMESSPFLTYDVREPSETAAEWLSQLTKGGFNPDQLLRIARRTKFADGIVDWIDRALVKPTETSAKQISEVAGLDASGDELSLVVESIRSAWIQVTGGQVDEVAPSDEPYDYAGNLASSADSTSPVQPGQTNAEQSSSPATKEDSPTLKFVSHWDERIDLGDGRILDANKLARAWRVGNRGWVAEKNGTVTTSAVLGELLRCDERHRDESDVAKSLGLHYSTAKPDNYDLRAIPGFPNIYWNCNVNNWWKAVGVLEQVASEIAFNPPPDSPLAESPRIEWWLPNKPQR